MAHAWMPEANRILSEDGGPLTGGAPRAVWLTIGATLGPVSVQSAAGRLISERRPPHLVWDPLTGEVVQLISVLRAGRALGTSDRLDWAAAAVTATPRRVNSEGRVCVQVGVLCQPDEPFTNGTLVGIEEIVAWLDSWGVPRRWPAGRPARCGIDAETAAAGRSRAAWARGGHFGASQVPECVHCGPGAIDVDRLTGPHGMQLGLQPVRARCLPTQRAEMALPIPA